MRLDIGHILYLESQKHNILIHTENESYVSAGPLKRFEELLTPKGFSKCHNSYLLNLKHVTGIVGSNALLTKAIEIPISRTRKKEFLDDLTDYIGGVTR